MIFASMKLKPESGTNRIKSADDAYSFMVHMRFSDQNKPHWQMARQALNNAYCDYSCRHSAKRGGLYGISPDRFLTFFIGVHL